MDNDEFNEFDKYLLFGDGYVEWKAFNHPQFGDIEIGKRITFGIIRGS
jgi:hypothetical protein